MEVKLREGTNDDAAVCGRICYEAFADISSRHGYSSFFPSLEEGTKGMSYLLSATGFYTFVAEAEGHIVGSGVLYEGGKVVAGIAVISVEPGIHGRGVGGQLMRAMMDRAAAAGFAGVRLTQEAYNRHSFSLYTKLGFETREVLVSFGGQPPKLRIPGYGVRAAGPEDIPACDALCVRVHGHGRAEELAGAITQGSARVVEHDARTTGYMTGLAGGHAVGESNEDLKALIGSADIMSESGFFVPARNSDLVDWCLSQRLQIAELVTLMTTGLYSEPKGAWIPGYIY